MDALCPRTLNLTGNIKRNATRDYLDFVALAANMGDADVVVALKTLDALYPQPNGESAILQLLIQLANPMPFDLSEEGLAEYRNLISQWQSWQAVAVSSARLATLIFDRVID